MSANVVNQVAYLRTSRNFPEDLRQLTVEVNKVYIDIANAVNERTISIFPTNRPAITGESWFVDRNRRQQGFRQVYTFTSTANIPHGINFDEVFSFVRCWGTYTDSATGNWYGIIHGTTVAIPGQITFYLTPGVSPTFGDIVFLLGAGAPPLTYGQIVLEWISDV